MLIVIVKERVSECVPGILSLQTTSGFRTVKLKITEKKLKKYCTGSAKPFLSSSNWISHPYFSFLKNIALYEKICRFKSGVWFPNDTAENYPV